MKYREEIEKKEILFLNKKASFSKRSKGRSFSEEKDFLRTEYMRDRDRIIHSESFRRLKHKTQVFLSTSNDSFRSRLTHTLEVSQIARTISRCLSLNEDLTEAIALGHDVGHTPFGHTGELVIREKAYPDFKHSEQSVRVLEKLEKNRTGLNLSIEVLDGILKHSKTGLAQILPSLKNEFPITLEAEVVRVSDIIAYINHDIEDAVKSNILKEEDLPEETKKQIGTKHSQRINTLVLDVIKVSADHINMSPETLKIMEELRDFLFTNVYCHPSLTQEMNKAKNILGELYLYLEKNMQIVYEKQDLVKYSPDVDERRSLVDFIALMTDNEALRLYYQHFIPKSFYTFG